MLKFYLALFLLASISIFSQNPKTDLVLNNLKGKVKSISIIGYAAELKDGKIKQTTGIRPASTFLTLYNNQGYIIDNEQYAASADHKLLSKKTYKFDQKKNRIIEMKEVNWLNTLTETYAYSTENDKLKITISHKYGNLVELFDKDVNKIETTYYPNDKTAGYNVRYKYDEFQNLIEENHLLDEYYDIYKYNDKRNIIENSRYSSKGELYFADTIVYTKFDNKGNWIEHITYDKSKQPVTITKRIIKYYN
jgi:hypothetical protein